MHWLNRFDWHKSLSKNKTIEIEGYYGQDFGFNISPRLLIQGIDHPGVTITISFWYTLSFAFYDNRHWDRILEDQDRVREERKKNRYNKDKI